MTAISKPIAVKTTNLFAQKFRAVSCQIPRSKVIAILIAPKQNSLSHLFFDLAMVVNLVSKAMMKVNSAIKVDFGNNLRLGRGKVRLLELVGETGSISAAARKMNMSYRRAWLLMDELNHMFGRDVIETAAGGSGGGGAHVTAFGLRVASS